MQYLVPHIVDLAYHVLEVVSSLRQESNRNPSVHFVWFYGRAVVEGCAAELPCPAEVEGDCLRESESGVEPFGRSLDDGKGVDEFLASHVEGVDGVGEGEHVVEVLFLQHSWDPGAPESTGVCDDKVGLRHCCVHEAGDEIAEVILAVYDLLEQHLIVDQGHQVLAHQGKPLGLEDVLQIRLLLDSPPVELPGHQFSSHCQLRLCLVIAGARVLEHLLADWHWSLYFSLIDLLVVEVQVEDVEVVPSVVGAHHWHTLDEVMRELVPVPLDHSVYGAHWERIQQGRYLVAGALALLLAVFVPKSVGVVRVAVVAHVTHYQHCVCPQLLQLGTALHHDRCILQELVGRERAVVEGSSGRRSLQSGKADDSDLDARLQREELFSLLQREKVLFALFRLQVGSQVGRLSAFACHIGKEKVGPEVKLVVADGRSIDPNNIVEVVHDLSAADQ